MQPVHNPIEQYKAEKDGLDILAQIAQLAARHGGWETIDPGDVERLKWIGTFFRKPTPGLFMMRVRITNGQATSRQLRTLADISRRLGSGILDLTTRQQVELRAVQIRDVPQIMQALQGVDLSSLQTGMDNIRNVNCCPLSGLTSSELFDAAPVGAEYTRIFLGNKAFTNLPRKLNVTITGCLENCTHSESQDLAMTPAVRTSDDQPGFNVAVGGKMGSGGMTVAQPLDVFVRPEEAASLAAEITLLFRDEGSRDKRTRARLAFLVQDWGVERLRTALEKRWGHPLERAQQDVRLPGETDHLGVHRQKQPGLFSVGLCVPTGRVNADQLDELARLSEEYGSSQVRLTTNQDPILINIPEGKLPSLLAEPLLRDFSTDPHPFFCRGLVTCTGIDYCNLALIETKSIGKRLAETLAGQSEDVGTLRMHWSGCPAGCGNHQAADIGFQGAKMRMNGQEVDAVSIFVGGRTGPDAQPGEKIVELVPVNMLEELMPVILKNMNTLRKVRREHEAKRRVVMLPAI